MTSHKVDHNVSQKYNVTQSPPQHISKRTSHTKTNKTYLGSTTLHKPTKRITEKIIQSSHKDRDNVSQKNTTSHKDPHNVWDKKYNVTERQIKPISEKFKDKIKRISEIQRHKNAYTTYLRKTTSNKDQ